MAKLTDFFGSIGRGFGAPFRLVGEGIRWVVALPREGMRNLFSLFMLLGIIALTLTNNFFLFIAKGAMTRGEAMWYGTLINQLEFNNYLIGWFSGIVGLLVFGADYLRAKVQGYELGFGKGGEPANTSTTSTTVTEIKPPEAAAALVEAATKTDAQIAAEQDAQAEAMRQEMGNEDAK